jgi:hypothetical protein
MTANTLMTHVLRFAIGLLAVSAYCRTAAAVDTVARKWNSPSPQAIQYLAPGQ